MFLGQRDSLSMSALATEPLLQRTNERPSINSEVWDVLATTDGAIPYGVFSHVIKPAYLTNNIAILWTQDITSFQADLFTISDFSAFGFHGKDNKSSYHVLLSTPTVRNHYGSM